MVIFVPYKRQGGYALNADILTTMQAKMRQLWNHRYYLLLLVDTTLTIYFIASSALWIKWLTALFKFRKLDFIKVLSGLSYGIRGLIIYSLSFIPLSYVVISVSQTEMVYPVINGIHKAANILSTDTNQYRNNVKLSSLCPFVICNHIESIAKPCNRFNEIIDKRNVHWKMFIENCQSRLYTWNNKIYILHVIACDYMPGINSNKTT